MGQSMLEASDVKRRNCRVLLIPPLKLAWAGDSPSQPKFLLYETRETGTNTRVLARGVQVRGKAKEFQGETSPTGTYWYHAFRAHPGKFLLHPG